MTIINIFPVSAANMELEYDGGVHEYTGSIYELIVSNKLLDPPMPPIIFNDRALVPVREIFEQLGAVVNYSGDDKCIEVSYNSKYIRTYINNNTAYVNGKPISIPDKVVPKLITRVGGETKTMVPIRFISETIGMNVAFDSEHHAILVNSQGYAFDDFANDVPAPTAAPADTNRSVTGVTFNIVSDNQIRITVSLSTYTDNYSSFTMNDPDRVVTDIPSFSLSGIDDIDVNAAGIAKIRLGDDGTRARIVADVTGGIKRSSASVTSNNAVTIDITTNTNARPKATLSPPMASPSSTADPQATQKPSSYQAVPSTQKLIVIDAGHGGVDSGAVGTLNGDTILEKDLTLSIANKVVEVLKAKGYTVDMTRTGDTLPSLVERPTQANQENAAVFVSIHINSVDNAPEANGTEIYYSELNNGSSYGATSAELAKNILDRVLYYTGANNRGVKTANHAVTKRCRMPATLVEVGFITNKAEVSKMVTDDYQYNVATGIAEGIIKTLGKVNIPNN